MLVFHVLHGLAGIGKTKMIISFEREKLQIDRKHIPSIFFRIQRIRSTFNWKSNRILLWTKSISLVVIEQGLRQKIEKTHA